MATNITAPPPPLEAESDDFFAAPSGVTRAMIGGMLLAKIGILTIVFVADPSKMTALFALISSWLWIIAAIVLLSGPLAYRWRLRKVRARRAALQRAEWMVDSANPTSESQ